MTNSPSKNKPKKCKHEWEFILEKGLLVETICKKCNLTNDLRPAYIRLMKAMFPTKEGENE